MYIVGMKAVCTTHFLTSEINKKQRTGTQNPSRFREALKKQTELFDGDIAHELGVIDLLSDGTHFRFLDEK
ncbi:hypothetical protein Q4R57_08475 [Morganella morganii]